MLKIDSTGLKVYGDGEWHMRTYGVSKRKTWHKIYLGIDLATQEVVCIVVSTHDVQNHERLINYQRQDKKSLCRWDL